MTRSRADKNKILEQNIRKTLKRGKEQKMSVASELATCCVRRAPLRAWCRLAAAIQNIQRAVTRRGGGEGFGEIQKLIYRVFDVKQRYAKLVKKLCERREIYDFSFYSHLKWLSRWL